jgi:multidrug efflux pump subunit AcrA (membrane-fusion protein)
MLVGPLLAGAAGCGQHSHEATPAAPKALLAVTIAQPRRQNLARKVEQPARVEAFEQTPVHVKIPGFVEKVHVEIGSRVKKGDLLAELWVPEMKEELKHKAGLVAQGRIDITLAQRALKVAQASARTAESLVVEARASRKRAEASYDRWKSEAARMQQLVRDKVIADQSRDEVVNQFKAAEAARDETAAKVEAVEAAYQESLARRDKAEADVDAARNRLLLAESDERRTAAMLEYARVTAPFDGVVSERHVHTGHFLQPASGPSVSAQPLFVVVRTDKVRVFLEVPETEAVLVKCGPKEGCPAHIRVPVLNDREFTGQVAGSSWSLDPGQRTLRTEIDFDNTDGALRPGMYAHAIINAEQPNAWTVPSKSLVTRDSQTVCYCLQEGKAVRTPVRVGIHAGSLIEVLKKQGRPARAGDGAPWVNFTGAESVITDHAGELTDGQEVQVSSQVMSLGR